MKKTLNMIWIALCAVGCGTTSSVETINSFDAQGNLMSERTSKITRKGLFVKSTALQIEGSTEYTVSDKAGKVLMSTRKGKAEQISSDPDEAAIKAGGEAVGAGVGEVIDKVINPVE